MARFFPGTKRWFDRPNKVRSYMGGYTVVGAGNYVREYYPKHPNCDTLGKVLQHRLVVEDHIGRYLSGTEVVHHKDENTRNNQYSNLQVMTAAEHSRYHNLAELTEETVLAALEGRTTLEAAKVLGVNHQTLRNRFDHLLSKRRSPIAEAEALKLLREYAPNPKVGLRDFVKLTGISAGYAKKLCEQHQIAWTPRKRRTSNQYRKVVDA